MSGTYTTTNSSTFTRTHAAYLASKVAADLRQMQRFYGEPSDQHIEEYVSELVELLVGGYLESVMYGFKKGGSWVVALKYVVVGGVLSGADDRPGRVPAGAVTKDASWYSNLSKNNKFYSLSEQQRENIEASLAVKRTTGTAPSVTGGWSSDRSYSSTGTSINRSTYIAP